MRGPCTILAGTLSLLALGWPMHAYASPKLPPNTVPIRLGMAPDGQHQNRILVTVRVCAHGTSTCVDVPDVLIDTGSTGLRLQKSALDALSPGFVKELRGIGAPGGGSLAGCTYFGSGDAWGRFYDLDIGFPDAPSLVASDVKVQVTDNSEDSPDRPAWVASDGLRHRCKAGYATSNGTLGVGAQSSDCREPCTMASTMPKYFRCEGMSCAPLTGNVPNEYRIHNPVLSFRRLDGKGFYNGIGIAFPPAASEFVDSVPGTMSFGFAVDPARTNAAVLRLPQNGYFTSYLAGNDPNGSGAFVYGASYLDTGTQDVTFEPGTTSIPPCASPGAANCKAGAHYTPRIQQKVTLTLVSAAVSGVPPTDPAAASGPSFPVTVNVGTWDKATSPGYGAATDAALVAASQSDPSRRSFVLGAPFFVGRRIHVLIAGQTSTASSALVGPAYAIESP